MELERVGKRYGVDEGTTVHTNNNISNQASAKSLLNFKF